MGVLIGTSGWQYRWWREVLYPAGFPQRQWLGYYARCYATVENNSAFYRLPARETFIRWHDQAPEGFVMAVKASRYLTHVKRLRDPAEAVRRLLGAAAGLGDRLGPVLVQLPPRLTADPPLLDECLACFPVGTRVAVEPRHDSWFTPRVREVLVSRGAALCWADRLGRPLTPLWRTAGWGYLRFHEGAASPWPRYGRQALSSWAARLARAWPDAADVFAFFNNDPGGAAVYDSARFAAAVRAHGRTASRTPAV